MRLKLSGACFPEIQKFFESEEGKKSFQSGSDNRQKNKMRNNLSRIRKLSGAAHTAVPAYT